MPQSIDLEAYPIGPHVQDDEPAEGEISGTSIRRQTQGDPRKDEALPQAQQIDTDNPTDDGAIQSGHSSQESQEYPGDFDDSANALWSLYEKEAKGYDEATIQTLKDDMDAVLIFAGLFSAALTAFIIDRAQNIQQNPVQQSAYFQQQSVVLLNQISHQLISLGAQIPNTSNFSLAAPAVNPSASDVRVNIYWFTSLVFSLSAALLATLVQRWARDHMHIFRRYSHPLKIARIRQYLHEGIERWYMPAIAEAVPGLVHCSLFLFLIGLADFLLHTYVIVGKYTVFPIAFCATLYIFSTVAPVMSPQSPYRTSFSGLVWYLTRKLRKRRCRDRFGIAQKPLSSNMADGQMQLAMEKSDARKGRDERSIRWLVNNLTEDIEVESLVSGIPGSFDAKWGVEVWKNDPGIRKDESITASPAGLDAAPPDDSIPPPPP
ncbi:hypothetical protein BJV74DRAFT_125018, partial [Russula compacta]